MVHAGNLLLQLPLALLNALGYMGLLAWQICIIDMKCQNVSQIFAFFLLSSLFHSQKPQLIN